MLILILLLTAVLLLAYPLGRYLALIMQNSSMKIDPLFRWIEQPIYRLLATDPKQGMNVRHYVLSFLLSCFVLGLITWLLLMNQALFPLNPDHAPNMSWDLALHTMMSFLTNTNQQHYAGQAQLSYLSQMMVIVGLQVITPMMGLAMVVATIRALFLQPANKAQQDQALNDFSMRFNQLNVGNYWADVIRPTVRFLLPLCLIWSLLLNAQGVPATLKQGVEVQLIDQSAAVKTQYIPLGPVAPMVAIKQLGSNGGGWYGPNSSTPLENPTALSNFLEMLAILLIPVSIIFMLGFFTRRVKFAVFVFASMFIMSLGSSLLAIYTESLSAMTSPLLHMEGQELRFGNTASALWAAVTTQVNNGSVNMMLDSAAPLTGLLALCNMLLNSIWGGIGSGLQQFMVYLLLAVFLAGLMTGRSPELFGRKIEVTEIKYLAVLILLQPIVILGLTAITVFFPTLLGTTDLQPHMLSQVLYEYVSAFANNGSGFEGLADNTLWWSLSCSVALMAGRFPSLIIPLWIAARLASKTKTPDSNSSLSVETPTFAFILICIALMLTLLQFMPVLVLGPIADYLLWVQG